MSESTEAPNPGGDYFGRDLEAMSFARHYHDWILAEIAPYLGSRMAEVGAGTGNFSAFLKREVDQLVAFEPSTNMFPLLRDGVSADPRITPVNGFFQAQGAAHGPFDSIAYINVLEHIERDEEELRFAQSVLQPGGHLLLFVPALPALFSNFDREVGHFRRYRKGELVALVAATGYELVAVKYMDIAGILPWYLFFVVLGGSLKPGGVSTYDRLVVPIMRRVERLIPPPVGKNLLLVARRSG